MKLSPDDAHLFMGLMVPLHWYVNQQAKIFPDLETIEDYWDVSTEDKIQVRDYLFSHVELIDQYLKDNPDDVDEEGASIIADWKNFMTGDFYIERWLKKYNIFIGDEDQVYGVLGLVNSPSDFMDKRNLPVRVQALLLPFKDKIVYDGFLRYYNISFGGGIRSRLKQTYLIAKDNDDIIQTFSPKAKGKTAKKSPKKAKATQDWAPLLDDLASQAKKLRGGSGQPARNSPIFSLVRASIELAQLATEANPDVNKLDKKGRRIGTLLNQVEDAIHRDFY